MAQTFPQRASGGDGQVTTPGPAVKRPAAGWRGAYAFFGGPLAWALELLIGYGLTSVACSAQNKLAVYILAGLALLVALGAGWIAYRAWRALAPAGGPALAELDASQGRGQFVAMSGFLLSVLFFGLVVVIAGFSIFLGPCPIITMPFP